MINGVWFARAEVRRLRFEWWIIIKLEAD